VRGIDIFFFKGRIRVFFFSPKHFKTFLKFLMGNLVITLYRMTTHHAHSGNPGQIKFDLEKLRDLSWGRSKPTHNQLSVLQSGDSVWCFAHFFLINLLIYAYNTYLRRLILSRDL
jgi:hypothetical protein